MFVACASLRLVSYKMLSMNRVFGASSSVLVMLNFDAVWFYEVCTLGTYVHRKRIVSWFHFSDAAHLVLSLRCALELQRVMQAGDFTIAAPLS